MFKSKKDLIVQIQLHKKEIEILKRHNTKRLKLQHFDRAIISILSKLQISKRLLQFKTPASSETLCKCLKTWNPLAYGREDYLFCLWEANELQDVEATVESLGLLEYLSIDTMRVDEIDWAALAKSEL